MVAMILKTEFEKELPFSWRWHRRVVVSLADLGQAGKPALRDPYWVQMIGEDVMESNFAI